jgi:hypothetical protein
MAGLIIPTYRRRISVQFDGRTINSLQSVAGVKDATVISISEGNPKGSRGMDHAEYATVHAQVEPGTVARITAYGPSEGLDQLRALKSGETVSALVTPYGSSRDNLGFKLVKFLPVDAPASADQAAA